MLKLLVGAAGIATALATERADVTSVVENEVESTLAELNSLIARASAGADAGKKRPACEIEAQQDILAKLADAVLQCSVSPSEDAKCSAQCKDALSAKKTLSADSLACLCKFSTRAT
jgi:hypothetical protein